MEPKRHSDKFDPSGVWIVIAAYNEAGRLGRTLEGLVTTGHTIVVVDDGSSDQTRLVAAAYPVWTLQHPINCGQGAALQTGIDFALSRNAMAVVTFDADGQHDPADLPKLLEPVLSGLADVALGSRFLGTASNIPVIRRFVLKLGVLFTRLTSGLKLTDTHNGFRVFSHEAATRIRIRQPRMAHASEILHQIGQMKLKHVEIPVTIRYQAETLMKGQSSWGALKITGHLLAGKVWK
jgi:polyprenyl-phospho-N-acetylgalactosaminyl synthase